MAQDCFLSVDWGTTHFRLRLVERNTLQIIDEIKTAEGIGVLGRDRVANGDVFGDVLARHSSALGKRHSTNVDWCLISGMASSSLGWKELPYARTPLSLQPASLVIIKLEWKSVSFPDLNVALVSGIRSANDVMRGEECELVGLIHLLPELANYTAATVIMPGTHSKHASLRNGTLTDFTTYMTGELFSHIQQMPTLVTCFQENEDIFDEKTFRSGVEEFRRKGLPAALFTLRARHVLNGESFATSFLGGILIGAELDQLSAKKNEKLFLCCSGEIQKNYMVAADCYKLSLHVIDAKMADVASVHGHAFIRNHLIRME